MYRYIVKRLVWFIPVLFIVITLSFFLMRIAKGGPFDAERRLPPAIEENIRARYNLDKPLLGQYLDYLRDLLSIPPDLGPSFKYLDRSVNEIIGQAFPISFLLGLVALTIAVIVGVSVGILSAVRPNTIADAFAMGIVLVGISIPNFIVGPLLILVFVFILHIFPPAGWGGIHHLILPGITLAAPFTAYIARLVRTGMLEVLQEDFIRTARAKGLSEIKVVYKHALKAGVLPAVSFLGPASASILTGSVVVERIFNIPGLGMFFINGALNRDYTLVMGTVILYSTLLLLLNVVVDIAYRFLDPRVQLGRERQN